jgi:general secretion pathway protein F
MAVFEFRGVVAASGKEIKGVRDAENAKGLRTVLRREGIVLTSAHEAKAAGAKKSRDIQLFAFMKRPSIGDVAILTRQLGTLVRAGIPLTDALAALGDQVEKEELKRVLASVREQVNQGVSFAVALGDHPKVFPPLYVNMVAAGEASGTLESVLDRLAQFMDTQTKLRGKVQAALAYPVLMTIIGSVLLTVLMMGVVPKVTAIFGSLGKALPWYTQLLIFVSESFVAPQSHGLVAGALVLAGAWPTLVPAKEPMRPGVAPKPKSAAKKKTGGGAVALMIVGGTMLLAELLFRTERGALLLGAFGGLMLGALVGAFSAWLRTEGGRFSRDAFFLRVPIFGPLILMIAVARFTRTLATLLASGVQLLRAMEIVRAVIGNAALERVVDEASAAIREGESIAEPLKRSKKFPPIVTHMIAVGEKSGQLEQMLEAVSDSYETAVETRITALTSLLEPLIIVIMGGAVGFVAFAILMPLIQMNDFNSAQ